MVSSSLRPKNLAVLLLASGDLAPRQRARDQQADLSGMALKARLLNEIIRLDPEPETLEGALEQIVTLLGPPAGPTRAVAVSILEEWHTACTSPEFVAWLLAEAVQAGDEPPEGRRHGRKNRPFSEAPEPGAP